MPHTFITSLVHQPCRNGIILFLVYFICISKKVKVIWLYMPEWWRHIKIRYLWVFLFVQFTETLDYTLWQLLYRQTLYLTGYTYVMLSFKTSHDFDTWATTLWPKSLRLRISTKATVSQTSQLSIYYTFCKVDACTKIQPL